MAKLAFLGLGVMGYPMAGHLLKKGGHDVTVWPAWSAGRVTAVVRERGGLLRAGANPRGMQGYAVGR